jgi:VWFA-related protein
MKWTVLLAWLASWAFASPPICAADQFFAHSYAVVIGIDHYPSRMWPQLQYGVKDARAIAAYLRTQDYDQIITLYDQQATKQAIVAAMQNQLAPKLKAKDRVLIFFAGHGYTETLGGKDRGYIVPYDGDTQSAGYISMDELETLSDYMGNARHQLFIMDSCYGGLLAVTRSGLVNPNIPDYLNNISDRVARQVITAGGKNQQVLDGGPKGHSFFVDYLLEALAEGKADTNGDGYITFDELSAYMVPRASSRQQTPMFGSLSGHQAGEYLFRSPLGRLAPVVSANEPKSGPVRGAVSETISPPVATETSPSTNTAIHSTTGSIKKISVTVVDSQGKFIPDIRQSNFRILEGGVPLNIVDFRDGGLVVAVLLEYSTSLRQHTSEITSAAAGLIDSLSPTDYVAVAEFDMRLKILTDFSLDRATAHAALNQLQASFVESNLFDALKDLADRMKFIREGRKAIVVFTTGVDTFSKLGPDQARAAIKEAGVPIYAVRLHGVSRMETTQTDENLKMLAADAGGRAYFPNSPDQYASALKTISDDLRGYEISFQRTGQEEHPGTSNIKVELVNAQTGGPLRMTDPKGVEVPYRIIVTPMP